MAQMTDEEILNQLQAEMENPNPQAPVPEAPTAADRIYGAQTAGNKQRMYADLLRSFQSMLQGAAPQSGFKADAGLAKSIEARADQPMETVKAQLGQEALGRKEAKEAEEFKMRKEEHTTKQEESKMRQEDFGMKLEKSKLDFTDMQANRDPASPQSKVAQDRVLEVQKKLGQPMNEQQVRSMSGEQLYKSFKYLQDDLTNFYKNQNASLERQSREKIEGERTKREEARLKKDEEKQKMYDEDRDENRELRKEQHKEKISLKEQQKLDKDVETISKRVEKEAIPQREAAMKELDAFVSKMGVNLEDPATHGKASIPGMGVGGGLRPDFLTPEAAVDFRQNVQSLANQLLKTRSGAAVTDQEYARFLKEAGSGNFSTEANLMSGLRKMKRDIELQKNNILKSAEPSAQKEYMRRMGEISMEAPKAAGPLGETTERNGKKYKWNAEAGKYQLIGE